MLVSCPYCGTACRLGADRAFRCFECGRDWQCAHHPTGRLALLVDRVLGWLAAMSAR